MAEFACQETNHSPVWGTINLLACKLLPERAGPGRPQSGGDQHSPAKTSFGAVSIQLRTAAPAIVLRSLRAAGALRREHRIR